MTAFFDAIGYDAVDAGPLAEGWRAQRDTPVYVHPYGSIQDTVSTPADASIVRAALARANRYRDA